MKITYRQLFEKLNEPYCSQAIANCKRIYIDEFIDDTACVSRAVDSTFNWFDSPQGYTYWDEVYKGVRDKNPVFLKSDPALPEAAEDPSLISIL